MIVTKACSSSSHDVMEPKRHTSSESSIINMMFKPFTYITRVIYCSLSFNKIGSVVLDVSRARCREDVRARTT